MRNPSPIKNPELQLRALNERLQQAYAAFRTGQKQQAEALCLTILAARAGEANSLHLLGVIANSQGLLDKAIAYLRRACLAPDAPAVAFSDLGEMLRHKGLAEEAEAFVRKAISLNDKLSNAWNNLGVLLQHNGDAGQRRIERLKEARSCFDRAIILQPDYFEAYWNRGTLSLLQGHFEKAWPDFEWRKRKHGHNLQIASSQPLWSGLEDISDKTILVHWEQGLGDTIQFCRYIEKLSDIAGKVLFWPQKSLTGLMRQADLGKAELVDFDDKSLVYDFRTPLMSLPVILKTTLATVPSKPAYIHPEQERIEKWQSRIGSKGFKIGISWKGSSGAIDAGRSIPLTHFLPLGDIRGVRLISLQKFEGLYQLQSLQGETRIETLGDDFDAGPDAFVDSAAVMSLCDLVITSDTAIAHLAGALGVPTWVGLKQTPDWRWQLDRKDSPWYPAMRLYRQKKSDDWSGVFDDIRADVHRLIRGEVLEGDVATAASHAEPKIAKSEKARKAKKTSKAVTQSRVSKPELKVILPPPRLLISWSDFIDRVISLEIKAENAVDKKAKASHLAELSQVLDAADPRWKASAQLLDYKEQLRVALLSLLDLEIALREKERKQEFDTRFIELARSFQQRTEERTALKHAIDQLLPTDFKANNEGAS